MDCDQRSRKNVTGIKADMVKIWTRIGRAVGNDVQQAAVAADALAGCAGAAALSVQDVAQRTAQQAPDALVAAVPYRLRSLMDLDWVRPAEGHFFAEPLGNKGQKVDLGGVEIECEIYESLDILHVTAVDDVVQENSYPSLGQPTNE